MLFLDYISVTRYVILRTHKNTKLHFKTGEYKYGKFVFKWSEK